MMRGIRLGSVFGFEIRLDYSWFIIFFLILWTLTFGVFPAAAPDLAGSTYILMGGVATVLFFASLLAHEISHSRVARAKGIPVEGITLFIFGGMAHTRMEAEQPGDEFAIAGVGPLASFIIAALFLALHQLGLRLGWGPAVNEVNRYLGFINLVLAVFNLLPGFPLDGGRLFRAVAWKATGDLRKATRWATNGGKILGYLLMGLGLLQFFAGAAIGGLWLVFIGWFVRNAADMSFRQHVLRESLDGIAARDVMSPDPQAAPAGMSIRRFIEEYIIEGRHRAYPVVEDGRPVGIITLDRVKQVPKEKWDSHTLSDVMRPLDDDLVVSPDAPMTAVLDRFGRSDRGRILVARNGELRGIITRADLARWIERGELLER